MTSAIRAAKRRLEAEIDLIVLGQILHRRDSIVRSAHAEGISKLHIHEVTGIARTTIDRILGKVA